jgi:hypothetical protein
MLDVKRTEEMAGICELPKASLPGKSMICFLVAT